ncbi:triphosphoribosyl-dephospho-CoA synthase [Candidatus Alkanophaga liquidiphilum]
MDEDYVARCAALALLLEVSASPKPGNVDRHHDFADTKYEHFLASAVAAYPVFRTAAADGVRWAQERRKCRVGKLIRAAVEESMRWQSGGNTHFGSFMLLIPLAAAAGASSDASSLKARSEEIMQRTTVEDAIELYKAFPRARVKVRSVGWLDVLDPRSQDEIRRRELTLYDVLKISAGYDAISRELTGGFKLTFKYAEIIKEKTMQAGLNAAIVRAYLEMLSAEPDTFVAMKFGEAAATGVSKRARLLLAAGCSDEELQRFDEELLRARINPGATADITAAAIFVALLSGLRV